jgi:hypothetical protein
MQASGAGTSPTARTGPSGSLTRQQRAEVCKRIVQVPSPLPASTKARLLKACERVGSSTLADVVHEICNALASREPAGAARERALAVCAAP